MHPYQNALRLFILASAVLGISACDALEDSSYEGRSIFELKGTVTLATGAANPSTDAQVALLWLHEDATNDVSIQNSSVGSQFPASFSLNLHAYPAESSLVTYEDMLKLVSSE
ncbi:MAG: hypothetical protein JRH20_14270, partial [Deltaproteobacteria bacterium]|nr:hypothetical protein [Deltaproteobacteria bacterium]